VGLTVSSGVSILDTHPNFPFLVREKAPQVVRNLILAKFQWSLRVKNTKQKTGISL